MNRRRASVVSSGRAPSRRSSVNPARSNAVVAATTIAFAAVLFVACGGSSHPTAGPSRVTETTETTTSAAPAFRDVEPTAADFVNINTMTKVGDHFVGSLNGHLDAALAVARDPKGGAYPVGTVIQLIPTEAMVKRRAGYSPTTGDWEFFSLGVSPDGTRILHAGAVVKNFFGGDCAACHRLAEEQFDFVCGKNHGCAPLPLSDPLIARIQASDPRRPG
jgi:hypothetical protein